jgi:hypothetical protein
LQSIAKMEDVWRARAPKLMARIPAPQASFPGLGKAKPLEVMSSRWRCAECERKRDKARWQATKNAVNGKRS